MVLPRKLDGREFEKENDGWTEVRGRRYNVVSSKAITSFFVSNIPAGTNRFELNEAFKPFGRITDVYIPGRKDKGGSYFGFVKFGGVKDVTTLERSMQSVRCNHCILKVNISKYEKKAQGRRNPLEFRRKDYVHAQPPYPPTSFHEAVNGMPKTGRSYAEVAGVHHHAPFIPPLKSHTVALKQVPAMQAWNNSALVGEVLSLQLLTEIPKLIESVNYFSINAFYAGGLRVVLRFDLPSHAQNFMQDEHNWNRWFNWL